MNIFTDPDGEWPQDYPMCNGSNQSPINIDTDNVTIYAYILEEYRTFQFSIGYKMIQKGPLENNGYTCMFFIFFYFLS